MSMPMTAKNLFRLPILAPMILMLGSVSVSAQSTDPEIMATDSSASELTGLTDQELLGLFNKSLADNLADKCKMAAMLSEIARRNFAEGVDAFRAEYLVQCAIERQDWPNAYGYIKQWEALGSENPPAMEWAFRLAYIAEEYDEALDRLEIMATADSPEQLFRLSEDLLFALARISRDADRDDRVARQYRILFGSPHFALLPVDIRSASASNMLKEQLKKDDIGDVTEMLAQITSPYSYRTMLADRLYEPAWPQVEQLAGPNQSKILSRYLQETKQSLDVNPDDAGKRQEYGHALLFSGRFDEVVTLAATIDHSDAGSQGWTEDDGWLLNLEAYALDAMGKSGTADQIFEQFGKIEYNPEENGWLVNFVINRATRLVNRQRWAQGLAAAQIAEEISQKSGSPYAKMLVRQAKLCALHNLGRSDEARAILSEIEEHQDDALASAAEALLCVGEREGSAKMVIKGLQDDKERATIVDALQKPEFELFHSASSLPSIRGELRNHPDVAKTFEAVARDIPDEYIPLIGVKRLELAAEREAD